jgi:Na+-translocating ferredoxin:NAD+ oxidoreductase RnfG subunit
MIRRMSARLVAVLILLGAVAGTAVAHITPPVVLASDREAVLALTAGARRFFVREVRLTEADRQALRTEWGWTPEADLYRFYVGRDEQGRLVSSVVFMTEVTVHGPVRVAVGIAPGSKVKGAAVVEVTEETYPWVKPLIDEDLSREYAGLDLDSPFGVNERLAAARLNPMSHFYGEVVGSLIKRGLALYEQTVRRRGAES